MKNFLTSDERASLKAQHRREHDGRIRDRIKSVLLSDDGWTQPMIAKALLIDDQTVGNYLRDYKESGKLKHESGGSTGGNTAPEGKKHWNFFEKNPHIHNYENIGFV